MLDPLYVWAAIALLFLVVASVRNVFLFVPRAWLPTGRVERALRYAPLASLAAILAPTLGAPFAQAGGFLTGLADPRVLAALALIVVSRASGNTFLALAAGCAVFLVAR